MTIGKNLSPTLSIYYNTQYTVLSIYHNTQYTVYEEL